MPNQINHILLVCFAVFGFFILANSFDLNEYPILDDFYFNDLILLGASVVLVSVIIPTTLHFKKTSHDISWKLFLILAVLWMSAEWLWNYDFGYDVTDPLSFIADIFWLAGYPFLFCFEIFYLKPFRKSISKQTFAVSVILATFILIPTFMISEDISSWDFEFLLAIIYPILDVIILIPAIIGMILFFRGRVSGIWNLMLLGVVIFSMSDLWYFFESAHDLYVPGNYVDALFICSYIVFSFGVWNNIRMFVIQPEKKNHR